MRIGMVCRVTNTAGHGYELEDNVQIVELYERYEGGTKCRCVLVSSEENDKRGPFECADLNGTGDFSMEGHWIEWEKLEPRTLPASKNNNLPAL